MLEVLFIDFKTLLKLIHITVCAHYDMFSAENSVCNTIFIIKATQGNYILNIVYYVGDNCLK